jgi:glycosyltransferase involved in cell wall biosynthesis
MKKKILVNLKSISGKISGIGFFTYNFFNTLKEIDGFEIYGIVDEVNNESIEILSKFLKDRLIIFNKKVKKRLAIFQYKNFIENTINKLDIDIYIEPGNLLLLNKKKLIKKTKIITVVHDIFPITHPEYSSKMYNKYFSFFMKKTIKNTDKYIFVSNTTKKSFYSFFKKNNLDENSLVVYNDVSHLMRNKNDKKKTADNDYFLFIGNLERRKGVDILLDAFLKYYESNGNKKLILAGSIREKKIEKKINNLKKRFESKFDYLGRVSEGEKNNLLKNCSAFIFPSRAEGFGIPPMEALLYGKPIILTNLAIFKEIYNNIPIYFDLENKPEKKLKDIIDNFKSFENFPDDNFYIKYQMKNKKDKIKKFFIK